MFSYVNLFYLHNLTLFKLCDIMLLTSIRCNKKGEVKHMNEIKINMNQSGKLSFGNDKMNVRVTLNPDGVSGRITDVHCTDYELRMVLSAIEAMGIQLGKSVRDENSVGNTDFLSALLGM